MEIVLLGFGSPYLRSCAEQLGPGSTGKLSGGGSAHHFPLMGGVDQRWHTELSCGGASTANWRSRKRERLPGAERGGNWAVPLLENRELRGRVQGALLWPYCVE